MTKKPKISRRKAKIICFEASNYGKKKSKILKFQKRIQFSNLTHYRNILKVQLVSGRLFENNKIAVFNIMQKVLKVPQTLSLSIFGNFRNCGISRYIN